jgi:hypothetical protein
MRLRYAGLCRSCSIALPVGTVAMYYRNLRQIACLACADRAVTGVSSADLAHPRVAELAVAEPGPAGASGPVTGAAAQDMKIEVGVAGASARREHARRADNREQRIRAAHPRLGGLLLAITDEPQTTASWARGAVGEEKLAQALKPLTARGIRLLHDRHIPGTRANILVGPAGVFASDAKRYTGRPTLKVAGGVVRPRTETLLVGRRDCTTLLTGVLKQAELIRAALTEAGYNDIPVRSMLCFVDADWPLFGGSFATRGVRILWPTKIADYGDRPVVLDPASIAAIHAELARHFPSA